MYCELKIFFFSSDICHNKFNLYQINNFIFSINCIPHYYVIMGMIMFQIKLVLHNYIHGNYLFHYILYKFLIF